MTDPDPAFHACPGLASKNQTRQDKRYVSLEECWRRIACEECGAEVQVFRKAEPNNGNAATPRVKSVVPGWHKEECSQREERTDAYLAEDDSSEEPFEGLAPHGRIPKEWLSWFQKKGK